MNRHTNSKGEVAVLYSPGYGAGWSTWADDEERQLLLFDPHIVEIVLEFEGRDSKKDRVEKQERIEQIFQLKGYKSYKGGAETLAIYWLKPGTVFKVDEYDGSESISVVCDDSYYTA